MRVQVDRIERTLKVVIAKPIAWLVYAFWLLAIHAVFAFGWTCERFRRWWSKGKEQPGSEVLEGRQVKSAA